MTWSNGYIDKPEQQCRGKVAYGTKQLAKRAIRRFRAEVTNPGARKQITAYRCPHCGRFHLGHKPGSRKAKPA